MDFPESNILANPIVERRYEIEIAARPEKIWPWLKQMGYHRAGWYIDAWWDRIEQKYFWPNVVPEDARGSYLPPADVILPEYQDIAVGDIIPDGPPGSAYYEVVGIEENRLLLLYATTHFQYSAPQFVYKTRLAPRGAFCWAFILSNASPNTTLLTSWIQVVAFPKAVFALLRPVFSLIDGAHQRAILRGIKKRVEENESALPGDVRQSARAEDLEILGS